MCKRLLQDLNLVGKKLLNPSNNNLSSISIIPVPSVLAPICPYYPIPSISAFPAFLHQYIQARHLLNSCASITRTPDEAFRRFNSDRSQIHKKGFGNQNQGCAIWERQRGMDMSQLDSQFPLSAPPSSIRSSPEKNPS